jgi:hypothetical protein
MCTDLPIEAKKTTPSTCQSLTESMKKAVTLDAQAAIEKIGSPATDLGSHVNNKFILVRRTARHKICRGCGPITDRLVPPFDYLFKHMEKYSYFDKKTKTQKQTVGNKFYHLNIGCIREKHRTVAPTDFEIPLELECDLLTAHKKLLLDFGLLVRL